MQSKNISRINFQSGLSKNLVKQCRNIDVCSVERELLQQHTKADFSSSKPVAFAVWKVIEVFNILKKQTHAGMFDITSPQIQTYLNKDLDFDFSGYGFCVSETQKIMKAKPPFQTGAVFFLKEASLESVNCRLDESFHNRERSSSHYLAPFIHEFLHGNYIDYIYKKYGYEGSCPYTRQKYKRTDKNCGLKIMTILKNLRSNDVENEIISDTLGQYASKTVQNQYHEVFAETFTHIICKCLSNKNSLPVKNPADVIRTLPKEFIKIVRKLFI